MSNDALFWLSLLQKMPYYIRLASQRPQMLVFKNSKIITDLHAMHWQKHQKEVEMCSPQAPATLAMKPMSKMHYKASWIQALVKIQNALQW